MQVGSWIWYQFLSIIQAAVEFVGFVILIEDLQVHVFLLFLCVGNLQIIHVPVRLAGLHQHLLHARVPSLGILFFDVLLHLAIYRWRTHILVRLHLLPVIVFVSQEGALYLFDKLELLLVPFQLVHVKQVAHEVICVLKFQFVVALLLIGLS